MKKIFFGLALAAVVVMIGSASTAKAATLTDTVTVNIDMPMYSVAHSGINLDIGSVSSNVLVLERFLQNRGYLSSSIVPDNFFDQNTKQSLSVYQSQARISSTGYFGPYTRAHMAVVLWFKTNGFSTRTQ
jgi:peptidoglycan hydrolase-like protein with peptidoglycan-binding domain